MSLFLFRSNLLEKLLDKLSDLVVEKSNDIFLKTVFVTQTNGMNRWISLKLAEKNGISSNMSFFSPDLFLSHFFSDLFEDKKSSAFVNPNLQWAVFSILKENSNVDDFDVLFSYAKGSELKLFQLSGKIADLFDQYMIYRPDFLTAWEKDEFVGLDFEVWQKKIWLLLKERFNQSFNKYDFLKMVENLSDDELKDMLPEKIFFFGLSVLSPIYFNLINRISKVCDVYLFFLSVSQEFLGAEILKSEKIYSIKKYKNKSENVEEEFFLNEGNPLFEIAGNLGRDFFDLVEELDIEKEERFFEDDFKENLLDRIKSDLFYLKKPDNSFKYDKKDKSIIINSAFSQMREVEILRNELLRMFDENPALKPADVLVMTPNIDEYAPYIDAVFGTSSKEIYFPYSIADRSFISEGSLPDIFLKSIEIAKSPFFIKDVFELLKNVQIAENFNLSPEDIEKLYNLFYESGVRWGIDKFHREKCGEFGFDENSWEYGIKRLLVGFGMLGKETDFYEKTLPFSEIEDSNSVILGRFLNFFYMLKDLSEIVDKKFELAKWSNFFIDFFKNFFSKDVVLFGEGNYILQTISELKNAQRIVGFDKKTNFDVVFDFLKDFFSFTGRSSGFINGGITFCSMKPMRSIPAKIICLIGMNEGIFPRNEQQLIFDLMSAKPRKGDRNSRNSDLYLFLESILSARDVFYISFIGRNIKTNEKILSSSIVDFFMDYLKTDYNADLLLEHPLHSFDDKYFEDKNFFTYIKEDSLLLSNPQKEDFLLKFPLPEQKSEVGSRLFNISIDDLVEFYQHPIKYFLKKRLGVFVSYSQEADDVFEKMTMDSLLQYSIKEKMVEFWKKGYFPKDLLFNLYASGKLPYQDFAKIYFKKIEKEFFSPFIEEFSNFKEINGSNANKSFYFEKKERLITLSCNFENLYAYQQKLVQLFYRSGKLRLKDKSKLWIYHIFRQNISPVDSYFLYFEKSKIKKYLFPKIEDKQKVSELQNNLIKTYLDGIVSFIPLFASYIEGLKFNNYSWDSNYNNDKKDEVLVFFKNKFGLPDIEIEREVEKLMFDFKKSGRIEK